MARILLLILLLCTAFASADGKYFGPHLRPVDTPYQRAVIIHEKGYQTMLIESFAVTGDKELSWVVPVPSEKTDIGVSRYSGHAANMMYRLPSPPKPIWQENWVWMALALGALLAASLASFRTPVRLLMAVGVLSMAVLYPPFLAQSAKKGVSVLKSAKMGPWEVSLVKSDDAAELRQWLKKRNTPLPPETEPVIADYIRRGWCFTAAHANLTEPSKGAPNGLVFRFPAEKPIYPMKLTGVGGNPLVLDLVVLSDEGEAAIKGMDVWQVKKGFPGWFQERIEADLGRDSSNLDGSSFWLTRLHGRLDAAAQSEDLSISFQPAKARETRVMEGHDFRMLVAQKAACGAILGMVIFGLLFGKGSLEQALSVERLSWMLSVTAVFFTALTFLMLDELAMLMLLACLASLILCTLIGISSWFQGGKEHVLSSLKRLGLGVVGALLLGVWFHSTDSKGIAILEEDGASITR